MKRFLPEISGRPQQRGVSVIMGVFLLMLMAVLAALLANLMSVTQVNMAADIGGSRAYQAARAGVEWGMYQLDPNEQTATLPTCAGAAGTIAAIANFSVAVQCTAYPLDGTEYAEGSKSIRIFHLVSTATALGVKAPGIERRVEVTIEKCRDSAITTAPYGC